MPLRAPASPEEGLDELPGRQGPGRGGRRLKRSLPPLPNLFVIGEAKCGTTTLHHHLAAHPHIYMTPFKEPGFFDWDSRWRRGWDWYRRSFFRGAHGHRFRGESTPATFRHMTKAIPRMQERIEDPRLVVILRDPVERTWSDYLMARGSGAETRPLAVALDAGADYAWHSRYAERLEAWSDAWGHHRLKVLFTHDLRQDPQGTMTDLFAWLGVREDVPLETGLRANPVTVPRNRAVQRLMRPGGPGRRALRLLLPDLAAHRTIRRLRLLNRKPVPERPRIDPELEARLRRFFDDDVQRVEDVLRVDLSSWRRGTA